MTWSRGYIELECGHRIGTAAWDTTLVGDDLRCPQCKAARPVKVMSRVQEVTGSRDFQLGVTHADDVRTDDAAPAGS